MANFNCNTKKEREEEIAKNDMEERLECKMLILRAANIIILYARMVALI